MDRPWWGASGRRRSGRSTVCGTARARRGPRTRQASDDHHDAGFLKLNSPKGLGRPVVVDSDSESDVGAPAPCPWVRLDGPCRSPSRVVGPGLARSESAQAELVLRCSNMHCCICHRPGWLFPSHSSPSHSPIMFGCSRGVCERGLVTRPTLAAKSPKTKGWENNSIFP